jgi:hypothetical protein
MFPTQTPLNAAGPTDLPIELFIRNGVVKAPEFNYQKKKKKKKEKKKGTCLSILLTN